MPPVFPPQYGSHQHVIPIPLAVVSVVFFWLSYYSMLKRHDCFASMQKGGREAVWLCALPLGLAT